MQKKVAIFSGIFHPESGGPATYLYHLGEALTQQGFQLKLLCFGEKYQHIYPYPVTRISRRWPIPLRLIIYFFNVLKLGRWADVLFVSDYGLPVALANFFLRKKTIIKIVGDFAWEKSVRDNLTTDNIDDFQKNPQCFRANILKAIQKFYVSKMDQVITPSNYLKSIISGWGIPNKKIKVIYNAIDLPTPNKKNLKNKSKKILLTAARLVPWKGIDETIKTLPELNKKFKTEYWIIGEGSDLARLKNIAKKAHAEQYVKFLGYQPRTKVYQFMQQADLFVLYSGYEGLPHVILEAAALGLPSLVSSFGGNPEVIKLAKCGKVCYQKENLAQDILSCLKKPPKIPKLPQELQWKTLVKNVVELINRV